MQPEHIATYSATLSTFSSFHKRVLFRKIHLKSNQIEDESHFLIYCNKYSILRNEFYKKNRTHHSEF